MKNKVIAILGPTSSGKSGLAVKLAKKFNGEIISADSRQIFKEMNLGTGKVPGHWKNNIYLYKNIPHHLIDFVSPEDEYNVSHFKKDCENKILEINSRGKLPILCGGTGFWIQAVVDGVIFPQVKPDPKLRKKLTDKSPKFLLKKLKELDPKRAETIDKKNPARLIRAIEIAEKIGQTTEIKIDYSSHSKTIGNQEIDFLQIGIPVEMEKLEKKIKARLKERFRDGMVKEILKLYRKYDISQEKIQNFGIAYSLVPLFKKGQLSHQELFNQIAQAEKKYAKRQITWFKKDPRIKWEKNYEKINQLINKFLSTS